MFPKSHAAHGPLGVCVFVVLGMDEVDRCVARFINVSHSDRRAPLARTAVSVIV
jgi:hypothetical protein